MNVKHNPFAINITEAVDRVPPAHGTTHGEELVQGLGGLVPGWNPAPFSAH